MGATASACARAANLAAVSAASRAASDSAFRGSVGGSVGGGWGGAHRDEPSRSGDAAFDPARLAPSPPRVPALAPPLRFWRGGFERRADGCCAVAERRRVGWPLDGLLSGARSDRAIPTSLPSAAGAVTGAIPTMTEMRGTYAFMEHAGGTGGGGEVVGARPRAEHVRGGKGADAVVATVLVGGACGAAHGSLSEGPTGGGVAAA